MGMGTGTEYITLSPNGPEDTTHTPHEARQIWEFGPGGTLNLIAVTPYQARFGCVGSCYVSTCLLPTYKLQVVNM